MPKIKMLALAPDAGTAPVSSLEAEVEMVTNKLGASVLRATPLLVMLPPYGQRGSNHAPIELELGMNRIKC